MKQTLKIHEFWKHDFNSVRLVEIVCIGPLRVKINNGLCLTSNVKKILPELSTKEICPRKLVSYLQSQVGKGGSLQETNKLVDLHEQIHIDIRLPKCLDDWTCMLVGLHHWINPS